MRCIIVLALCLAVTGCARKPAGPPPAIDPPAVCVSKPQCDAMWSEAMVQAQNLSGMRIQTATDSFLQTYNPVQIGQLGAMARKMPQANGSTVIEATFTCQFCGNLAYSAVNLFTANVKRAGAGFGPVEAGPAAALAPSSSTVQPLGKKAWQDQQIKKLQESDVSYEEYQIRYKKIMGE